jgi:AAA15 family ATPase/GTPase
MITKLALKNFRCFNDFTLDGIGPVTLIAGGNNVGKSTILESILLFMERHSADIFPRLNNIRGLQQISLSPMMMWEPLFANMDMSKSIEICINENKTVVIKKDDLFSAVSISPKNYGVPIANTYPLMLNYKDPNNDVNFIFTLTEAGGITLSIDKTIVRMPNTIYFNSKTLVAGQQITEAFSVIELAGNKAQCVDVLKKLDVRIKDLSVVVINGISGIFADIGLNSRLSINMLGDGINKLLHIVLAMLANPSSLILIDEIENGFHYSFYPKLWDIIGELAIETDCQVFATTHSYECIEGAMSLATNKDKPDLFRFIRLDRENDKIVPKVFANDSFEYSVNNGWEVR